LTIRRPPERPFFEWSLSKLVFLAEDDGKGRPPSASWRNLVGGACGFFFSCLFVEAAPRMLNARFLTEETLM